MKTLLLVLLLLSAPFYKTFAASDIYHFDSQKEQQRFELLTSQLRCLVCQNQNLAESNAGLAIDLRNQVYAQIQHGNSDQQIIHYLVTRYGDFILYRPPLRIGTLGLWFGPFFILLLAMSYLMYYLHKNKKQRE